MANIIISVKGASSNVQTNYITHETVKTMSTGCEVKHWG